MKVSIVRFAGLMAGAFVSFSSVAGTVELPRMEAWELILRAYRPQLPLDGSRTLKTLEASAVVRNGGTRDEAWAIAEQTLGPEFADEASWQTTFRSADERIDVAELVLPAGAISRFAVYGQYGNYVPYYWIVDGLAASGPSDVAGFLLDNGIVDGGSSVRVADGVLSADEIRIAGRGEEIVSPYARFRFAFVDDRPGANWAHPCRYVFISEDWTSFVVLYKRWMPRLVVRSTGEGVWLQKVEEVEPSSEEKLDAVKSSVYGYARNLVSNGLSYRSGDRSKSYFVLISGGENPGLNGIRYWCDIAMMYSTLTLKYGVPKRNIRVYMSDGRSTGYDANLDDDGYKLVDSPRDLDGDGSSDVTDAATKSNVRSCFATLRSRLKADDQLFVLVTGHGDAVGTPGAKNYNCCVSMFTSEEEGYYYKDAETVTDKEMAAWTKGFACPVAFAFETCYSGGFIDDLVATPKRIVATACNHYEESWGRAGGGRWRSKYGQTGSYNYWSAPFIAAFRGCRPYPYGDYGYPWEDLTYYKVNADSNGDGKVSFNEARIYAANNDNSYESGESYREHPQYGESTKGLGASFFILKPSTAPTLFTGSKAATPFAGDATYNGWVRNANGALAGLLTVKAAKAGKDGRSKLTVAYTPFGGKKQAIKIDSASMPMVGDVATVVIPGIGTVKFTGDEIVGVNVDVQAGRDTLKSKDRDEKAKAAVAVGSKTGLWTFALGTKAGYAAFSVTVDKKGKGKLVGTLPDGMKVSLSAQGVLGDSALAIPFLYAKKGSLGLVFWVKGDGSAAISDLTDMKLADGTSAAPSVVAPSASIRLSDGAYTFTAGGVSQGFTVAGKKWNVPRQNKKADPDPNPTGLKLAFTEKTGAVKGMFTVVNGTAKTKYTVVGAVVGGKLYGAAYARNVDSVSVTSK